MAKKKDKQAASTSPDAEVKKPDMDAVPDAPAPVNPTMTPNEMMAIIQAQQAEIQELKAKVGESPVKTLRDLLLDTGNRIDQFLNRRKKYPGSIIAVRDQINALALLDHALLDDDVAA